MRCSSHRCWLEPRPASLPRHPVPGALRLLALLLATTTVCLQADDLRGRFAQANRLYEEGQFKAATAAYHELVQAGKVSTALYFNLGNACFKSGQLGRAIVAYQLAERLAPRDPDVQANLKFARESAGDSPPAAGRWRETLRKLTANEWTALATGAVWTWLILLTLREWRPQWRGSLRGYTAATGVAAAALVACLALTLYDRLSLTTAVVVTREATVRYGPLSQAKSAYVVHDGSELTVLDQAAGWLEVSDDNRRVGWLPQAQVVVLPRLGSGLDI
ncbi:MAG: tetratricopeptide repeat protein [Verrucomicrobia bacterium]|nr:tetratricopeptide repeat protein [Verrucomicrobiota bacterium]